MTIKTARNSGNFIAFTKIVVKAVSNHNSHTGIQDTQGTTGKKVPYFRAKIGE